MGDSGGEFDLSDDDMKPKEKSKAPAKKSMADTLLAQSTTTENAEKKVQAKTALGNAGRRKRMNVYTFGEAQYSKLGHDKVSMLKTPKLVSALLDKDVIDIVYGEKHALALTADGQIYSWGYGGDGQLGHGDQAMQPVPRLITALSRETVVKVTAGKVHSACITKFGQVFTWGDSPAGQLGHGDLKMCVRPKVVAKLFGKTVVDLAAGDLHTIFVTIEGDVYSCGSGLGGRLGHEDGEEKQEPTLIDYLSDKGIQQVKSIGAVTVAFTAPPPIQPLLDQPGGDKRQVTADANVTQKIRSLELQLAKSRHDAEKVTNELNLLKAEVKKWEYEVGNLEKLRKSAMAENLKLGFEKAELMDQLQTAKESRDLIKTELEAFLTLPSHFEELSNKGVKQIASGSGHVLALLDNGEVKCCGDNSKGQLGLGHKKKPGDLRTIAKLRNKSIKMIACGNDHSVALTYAGDVYCWGSSQFGQCGVGKKGIVVEPTKVTFSNVEKLSVRVIGAGAKHTVALTGDGRVFVWGRLEIGGLKGGGSADMPTPTSIAALKRADAAGDLAATASSNKNTNEIKELIHVHGMDAKLVAEMLPNLSEDPAAQLLLTKELNKRLERETKRLREEKEEESKKLQEAEKEFRNNQAKRMEKADEDALNRKREEIKQKEMLYNHRVLLKDQLDKSQVELKKDIEEIEENIKRVEKERVLSVSQARTEDKATLQKALNDVLHDLEVTRGAKDSQLRSNREELEFIAQEVDAIKDQLDRLKVEEKQYERFGLSNQLKLTRKSVEEVMSLREKLEECTVENLNVRDKKAVKVGGLSTLIDASNAKIDAVVNIAKLEVDGNDGIDPDVRRALMRLIVDNASLRRQLNHYTWGLMQVTSQRDDALRSRVTSQAILDVSDFTAPASTSPAVKASSNGLLGSLTSLLFGKTEKVEDAQDRDRERRDRVIDLGD